MDSEQEYLQYLRGVFRQRMKEENFCIGEEQVEKLFRELLGEPEPAKTHRRGPTVTLNDISAEFAKQLPTISAAFNRKTILERLLDGTSEHDL